MIEAGVSATIALVTALAILHNRAHSKITELGKRVDAVSVTIARDYISRTEHAQNVGHADEHLIRIEQKLDSFIQSRSADHTHKRRWND